MEKEKLKWKHSLSFEDLINKLIEDEIKYQEWWMSKNLNP